MFKTIKDKKMKVSEKILLDKDGLLKNGPINIVILGESVSHASFLDYHDYDAVYWNVLRNKLYALKGMDK